MNVGILKRAKAYAFISKATLMWPTDESSREAYNVRILRFVALKGRKYSLYDLTT